MTYTDAVLLLILALGVVCALLFWACCHHALTWLDGEDEW